MKKINIDTKFPHPVQGLEYNIWEDRSVVDSDRVLSAASCDGTDLRKIDDSFRLAFSVDLKDPYISNLVADNKARLAYEVDCPVTMFRYCKIVDGTDFSVVIPESKVYEAFTVTISVIAITDIVDYNNPNEDEDFADIGNFNLKKGDLLSYVFYKKYYLKQASKVESFITIEGDDSESRTDISYKIKQPYISIIMPKDMFQILNKRVYRSQETQNHYLPLVMGSVINEALILAIMNIKSSGNWDRPWAKAIRNWVERTCGEDFKWGDDDEPIKVDDAIAISHKILSNPFKSLFEQIDILKVR